MQANNIPRHYLDPYPQADYPVLLLHGLGADASSWQYQFEVLGRASFRPVAVDLPGFGKTRHQGRWTIRFAANQACELMLNLVNTKFDVVGISMGGVIAQDLTHQFPSLVRKLVLVNTFACLRPRRFGEWLYLLRRFVIANIQGVEYQAKMVAVRLFPETEQTPLREELIRRILESDRKVYRAAMWQLARFDSRKWLKDIFQPTLVISGELDTTVPLINQNELAKGIPGSRQVIISKARHGVIVDQPEKFNRSLLTFLEV
jgi:pimeloyl-ACP methyl ester carboxylesterase